uniref:Uncharacterized protein n=1 Tax=Romanomermis culicivorax TaxID=13658 RepID=A0A915KS58_ROMCU
ELVCPTISLFNSKLDNCFKISLLRKDVTVAKCSLQYSRKTINLTLDDDCAGELGIGNKFLDVFWPWAKAAFFLLVMNKAEPLLRILFDGCPFLKKKKSKNQQ